MLNLPTSAVPLVSVRLQSGSDVQRGAPPRGHLFTGRHVAALDGFVLGEFGNAVGRFEAVKEAMEVVFHGVFRKGFPRVRMIEAVCVRDLRDASSSQTSKTQNQVVDRTLHGRSTDVRLELRTPLPV